MSGRRLGQYLFLVLSALLQLACHSAEHAVARQQVLEWPQQRLLFIADERTGQVRSFFLGHGAPVPFAQTRSAERSSVRELHLDQQRSQLWVLGEATIDVYDARDLALQRRLPLASPEAARFSSEANPAVTIATF